MNREAEICKIEIKPSNNFRIQVHIFLLCGVLHLTLILTLLGVKYYMNFLCWGRYKAKLQGKSLMRKYSGKVTYLQGD